MGEYYHSAKYRLPVPAEGTTFNETEEQKLADVLDRYLYRVIQVLSPFGEGTGVIKEGTYSGIFSDGGSMVKLSSTSQNPAIWAFIDFKSIYYTSDIVWTGLENNRTYYLYLRTVETDTESTAWYGDFEAVALTTSAEDSDYLLLAVATTTDSSISVEINPAGKRRIHFPTDYDGDMDGTVDDSQKLSGKTLDYILDRSHHTGKISWLDIDTSEYKVSTEDLSENERVSLRFKEIFGNFWVEGDAPTTSSTLTHTIPSQKVIIGGNRIVIEPKTLTYLVNKDYYIDVTKDGEYLVRFVVPGAEAPEIPADAYRLFKVETRYAESAKGRIWVQFQPADGDTVTICNITFTATNNLNEVQPGNKKFYTGETDSPAGWRTCAVSLVNAINSANDCPVYAQIGKSPNEVVLTHNLTGSDGNILVQVNCSTPGTITAEGLTGGHGDCITKVIDYRAKLYPYWREPAQTKTQLPTSGVDGEVRLVLDESALYRYDKSPKFGTGYLRLLDLPAIEDRIQIGKVVLIADTYTNVQSKRFAVESGEYFNENVFRTLVNIETVLEGSTYPSSDLDAYVSGTALYVETLYANESENRPIRILSGDSGNYELSGIDGAGIVGQWLPVENAGLKKLVVVKRGYTEASSGQQLFTVDEFEDDLLFVYREGLLQHRNVDYVAVSTSGVEFDIPFEEGERLSWFVLSNKVDLQTRPLQEYTFITDKKHSELLKSIDLETHHVFHSEISHDDVPIADIGDKYVHRGVYKVLGDHVGDDLAHALPGQVIFRWRIKNGTTSEKFKIEGSTIQDFSDILFTYDSSTVNDEEGIFEYYADVPGYILIYSTNKTYFNYATCFSGISSDIDGIYYLDYSKLYKDVSLKGTDWTEETVAPAYLNGIVYLDNKLWIGASNGALYKKEGNTWAFETYISGISIYSVDEYQGGIVLGADGEVYSYNPQSRIASSIIDIPVERVTALTKYGGMLFVGTQSPARIYKYDGETITLDYSLTSSDRVSSFYEYQGRLYAGDNVGRIYVKPGLNESWVLEYNINEVCDINSFVEYKGYLYCSTSNGKVFVKTETGWKKDYTFNQFGLLPSWLVATQDNLFVSNKGDIYKKVSSFGWQKVPEGGVDSTIYHDKEVRFTLKDVEVIKKIKQNVYIYGRYKQYPTDNAWYYFLSQGSGGGGSTTFIGLTDTPNSYGGQGGKVVKVKASEDGLEFYSLPTSTDEKVKASSTDPIAGYLNEKVIASITVVNNRLQLTNDVNYPAPSSYYGTNSNGVRGFYSLPPDMDEKVKASSTDPSAGYLSDKVKRSITIDDNKLQLANDIDSPAPSSYYGTDSNGVRGFHSLPDLSEGTGGMPTSFVIDYRLWRGEYEGNVYFQFQTSEYPDFSVLEYNLDSKTNRAMWIMFDGDKWIDFYQEGMPTTFSHAAVYGLSFSNANSRYVRWRAYYIDDTGNAVYGDWRGHLITKTVVASDKLILTIEVQGSGSVVIIPEKDKYDRNENVTLSAIPSDNWEFSHWEVDLTGNQNPATITMTRNKYIRAVFTLITLNVTVSPPGVGKVTKDPDKTYYNKNESVTITAEPV